MYRRVGTVFPAEVSNVAFIRDRGRFKSDMSQMFA